MSRRTRRERQQGGSLVFVLVVAVILLALVANMMGASQRQSQASVEVEFNTKSWYAASAGMWAAANSLSNGGSGNLTGSSVTGSYSEDTGLTDSNGDGVPDFSSDAALQLLGDGGFQVRIDGSAASGDPIKVVARGVSRGRIRALSGLLDARFEKPFSRCLFSAGDLVLTGGELVDSYDSDVLDYANTSPKGSNGHLGANRNIDLTSTSAVHGNANPGPSGTIAHPEVVSGNTGPLPEAVSYVAPTWTVPSTSDNLANLGIGHGDTWTVSSSTTLPQGSYVFQRLIVSDATLRIDGAAGDEVKIYIISSGDKALHVKGAGASIELVQWGKASGPTVKIFSPGMLQVEDTADFFAAGDNGSSRAAPTTTVDPSQLQYYSTNSSKDAVVFAGHNNVAGVFYVPTGGVRCEGDVHLFGAVVADECAVGQDTQIHYDESLGNLTVEGRRRVSLALVYDP